MQILGLDSAFVAPGLDLTLGPSRWGVALLAFPGSFLLAADHRALVVGGDGHVHRVVVWGGSVAVRGAAVAVVAVGLEGLEVLWQRPAQGPRRYLQILRQSPRHRPDGCGAEWLRGLEGSGYVLPARPFSPHPQTGGGLVALTLGCARCRSWVVGLAADLA